MSKRALFENQIVHFLSVSAMLSMNITQNKGICLKAFLKCLYFHESYNGNPQDGSSQVIAE